MLQILQTYHAGSQVDGPPQVTADNNSVASAGASMITVIMAAVITIL